LDRYPHQLSGGPTAILELCQEKLFHVHLHGFKDGLDHHPPLCPGDEIQWEELIPCLWKIGYQGYLHFEPQGRAAKTCRYFGIDCQDAGYHGKNVRIVILVSNLVAEKLPGIAI
jgi:sugar phosphate isomerase/epimerase